MAGFSKTPLVQLPDTLPPLAFGMQKTCLLHYAQVLGDRLAGDFGAEGQAGDGQRAAITQPGDEP